MDDILVRIDRSSVNEESCDLVCRLIDCKGEIERLRRALCIAAPIEAGSPGPEWAVHETKI